MERKKNERRKQLSNSDGSKVYDGRKWQHLWKKKKIKVRGKLREPMYVKNWVQQVDHDKNFVLRTWRALDLYSRSRGKAPKSNKKDNRKIVEEKNKREYRWEWYIFVLIMIIMGLLPLWLPAVVILVSLYVSFFSFYGKTLTTFIKDFFSALYIIIIEFLDKHKNY